MNLTPVTLIVDEQGKAVNGSTIVREHIETVLEAFASGTTCDEIAEQLTTLHGPKINGWTVRKVMRETSEWAARYDAALSGRAHQLLERTLSIAKKAEQLGDAAGLRVAADTYFKLAAKLAPNELGEKAQVTLGGTVRHAPATMTDEQLMQIAAGGLGNA